MHILLSNDDGYQSRGLTCLAEALRRTARVSIVAPDRDRSGASNSLTLTTPLRAYECEDGVIAVNGTPTDCVHLAITGLLDDEPDMVIAGINHGANLGDDVIYSGTVAAAMEGRFMGYPAMAVSLTGSHRHVNTAVEVVVRLVHLLQSRPLPKDTILNVNVPDVDMTALAGWEATRLGHRHKAEPMVKATDPRGLPIYWVGPAGPEQDAGPGTDFHAVRHQRVSVTPIHVDLTRHSLLPETSRWLEGLDHL